MTKPQTQSHVLLLSESEVLQIVTIITQRTLTSSTRDLHQDTVIKSFPHCQLLMNRTACQKQL